MRELAALLRGGHVRRIREVCPRCANDLPNCTTPGYTHTFTCQRYRWSADLCSRCAVELKVGG